MSDIGADTMVLQLIDRQSNAVRKATQAHLDKFAGEGLRTLCCAYRTLDANYFRDWAERQHEVAGGFFTVVKIPFQGRQQK